MDDNNLNLEPEKKSFIEKYKISYPIFAFLALGIIFISYQVIGGALTLLILGSDLEYIDVNLLRIFTGLSQIVFILIPTILMAKLLPAKRSNILALSKMPPALIIIIIVCTFAFQEVLQILLVFQQQIPLPESIKPVIGEYKKIVDDSYRLLVNSSSLSELSLVVIIIAVIPAICEEFLFRGLLQHCLINSIGPKWGIIFGGIIFGIFHFNPFAIIPLILLGIFFGFLVYRSGSIFPAIIGHFTNNFISAIADFFIKSDDILLQKTDFEITMELFPGILLIFSVSLLVFLLSLKFFIKKTSTVHLY